ncbi:hypothetical protein Tco_0228483 [Tanacetum coccineum]
MHQFWNTIKKIKDTDAYRFKLDKQKFRIDTEVFCEILHICPRLPNQDFNEPPSKEEMVSFIKELGYTRKCDMLSEIHTDRMHQPWRIFAAIIIRCISGKSTGLDRLRASTAQILWGMFYQKNVDYAALLWEDFMFQADNRDIMYPVGGSFVAQIRRIFLDGYGVLIFRTYGALILDEMINQAVKDSKAHKSYFYFATRKATPKKARKFKKIASPSQKLTPILEEEPAKNPKRAKKSKPSKKADTKKNTAPTKKSSTMQTVGVVIRDTPGVSVLKKKAPAKVDRGKGIDLLSDVALLEAAQLKEALKKSKQDTHMLHASGLGDGVGSQLKFLDELKEKTTSTHEGTSTIPRVPDVPKVHSESENESWGDSEDDDDSNDDDSNDDNRDDVGDKEDICKSDDDHEEADDERKRFNDEEDETQDDEYYDEEEYEELYGDVNISLRDAEPADKEKDDEEMMVAGQENINQEGACNQVKDDAQTRQKTEGPIPSSSISSDYAAKYLNFDKIPSIDTKVVSMLDINVQHEVPQATILTTVVPDSETLSTFHKRITDLEKDVKELKTTDHSAALLSTIKSEVPKAVNEYLGTSLDDALHKVLKKHLADLAKKHSVLVEVVERFRKQYVPEKSTKDIIQIKMEHARKQQEPKETITSSDTTALKEINQKTTLFETMTQSKSFNKSPKHRALYHALMESIIEDEDAMDEGVAKWLDIAQAEETVFEAGDTQEPHNQGQDKGNTNDQPNVKAAPKHDWFKKPERPPTPDPDWNARKLIKDTQSIFRSIFKNNLKIDNLTQDLLVGPDFNLLKGTCKSKEYLFELSKPLPLIMERDLQVVPADFFFNNDLEYLKSKKYTNLTTKTKAANYDIPGIKDMVPSLWSPVKEIEVQREDQQLYKFKEGDFPILYLYDIEDMLLLLFQKKLSNLERDVLFDLGVALRMFTRRIVILKHVEDLQLGVESYQKRLKITKPETFRLMRSDELYKFSDGTLTFVRSVLYDISLNLRMEYLPNRRWSNLNRQRSRIMIKAIDKMQLERRSFSQHQSDTKVFTMMMEILPEPTSNKLCGRYQRSNEEGAGNQVKDDAQATQKTEVPIPSSSISSDYAAKYLNFDNIPPVDVKVVSMLDINVQHEAPPTTSTTVVPGSKTLIVLHQRVTDLEKDVKEHNIVDHSVALLSTIKYEVPNAIKEYLGTSLDDALHKVLQKHSADITKEHSVPAEIVERLRQQYVPEKTQKTSQKARWGMQESSKCLKPPQTWISKIAKAEKPSLSFDELMSTPIDFSGYVMNNLKIDNLTHDLLVRPAFNFLKGTCKSRVELEYNFEECYKVVNDRLDWNNPEVVPADFFFNNDLEYLKGGSSSKKYTTSTTKTKAAKYDIPGIKDMVPLL